MTDNELLENYTKQYQHIKHLDALYLMDLNDLTVIPKVLVSNYEHTQALPTIERMSQLLIEDELRLMYSAGEKHIFLKRLASDSEKLLIVVANTQVILGNVFSLLRKV